MNNTNLIGRLVRDPELKKAEGGLSICSMTIAIDDFHSKTEHADFIRVKMFGGLADRAKKYLKKGFLVGVDGRIHTDSYKDKDDIVRYPVEVIAENLHFLQWPSNESQSKGDSKASAKQAIKDVAI